ncbi:oxidoreductase [Rhizosaccharibacter radicis]|uniref:Oxidoreductase n=1 Tax=Rhizosaccharibacter radicis TaxID=2782605 RepID=A0ABT1VW34_9PROT|nr:oxidoreductase [Acetobacteraceae bacterium KSS12]
MTEPRSGARTWLITGCSSGLGRVLAEAVADRGDNVVATARDPAGLAALQERFPGRVRTATLDVSEPATAVAAVELARRDFGGLDVLVNNAGYGLIGGVEETEPHEYRPMFEVNVFGLIETTRAALPALRERAGARSGERPGGRIVNLSSGAGIAGSAGSGYYCASKFAVEGFSEALAEEVAPFGIRVLIVEPGPFRTDFLGRSITEAARNMPEYAATAGRRRAYRERNDGQQAGDPAKAVAVMLQAIDAEEPPLHLPIGPIALGTADRKLAAFRGDIERWRQVAAATDFI